MAPSATANTCRWAPGRLRDILLFFAQVPFLPAYIALRLLLAR